VSARTIWAGRALSGLAIAFLLVASVLPKLSGMAVARDTLEALGWDGRHALTIGLVELACVILYAIRRTSVLGAVLTTALLGGAIAAQMRAGSPLFTHTLFGVYLGIVVWGGLWLRNPALRALFPFARDDAAGLQAEAGPARGAHA